MRKNRSAISVTYANKCLLIREKSIKEKNEGVVLEVFVQTGKINKI